MFKKIFLGIVVTLFTGLIFINLYRFGSLGLTQSNDFFTKPDIFTTHEFVEWLSTFPADPIDDLRQVLALITQKIELLFDDTPKWSDLIHVLTLLTQLALLPSLTAWYIICDTINVIMWFIVFLINLSGAHLTFHEIPIMKFMIIINSVFTF